MSIQSTTIKRLYAKSGNQCAMPKCTSPIILGNTQVGEICHIKARSKKGPRYDASLTQAQKDAYANLLLLCRTCHKQVDFDPKTYSADLLAEIKEIHERHGATEITAKMARESELLLPTKQRRGETVASAHGESAAVAIGGDNHGDITINQTRPGKASKYPPNSIGADANFAGYVDYLFGLAIDYWAGVPGMTPGRLGKKIKTRFRLKTRTRHHLPVQRFTELVEFLIRDLLKPSPAGKRHYRNGTRLCRTFDEWRHGEMK